jgi:biopolymer transport protein ExbD
MTGIRSLNVGPFFALFAILTVAVLLPASSSRGEAAQIAKYVDCGGLDDRRVIVIRITDAQHAMLNLEPWSLSALTDRLYEVFKTRAERVVFIDAAPDVPFQVVAQMVDAAKKQSQVVALLPSGVRGGASGICLSIDLPTPQERESTGRRPL